MGKFYCGTSNQATGRQKLTSTVLSITNSAEANSRYHLPKTKCLNNPHLTYIRQHTNKKNCQHCLFAVIILVSLIPLSLVVISSGEWNKICMSFSCPCAPALLMQNSPYCLDTGCIVRPLPWCT